MKLSKIIDQELLLTELKSDNTNDVLIEMTELLKDKNKISDSKEILKKLLEREKLASTSIGKKAAIPHAKIRNLKNPVIMIAISRKGFLYNSSDNEHVNLIILILSPSVSPALHLQILAAAASLIKKPGNLIQELVSAKNSTELKEIIMKYEEIND